MLRSNDEFVVATGEQCHNRSWPSPFRHERRTSRSGSALEAFSLCMCASLVPAGNMRGCKVFKSSLYRSCKNQCGVCNGVNTSRSGKYQVGNPKFVTSFAEIRANNSQAVCRCLRYLDRKLPTALCVRHYQAPKWDFTAKHKPAETQPRGCSSPLLQSTAWGSSACDFLHP